MSDMHNLQQRPPESKKPLWQRQVFLWIGIGIVIAIVAITGFYYFDVATESNTFCGVLCHPNNPEYVTHEVSPHANVECGTCHVGPGLLPKLTAKIFGVQELYALVTNTYARPIEPPVQRLRPAREICEQCHWPEKLYGDRVVRLNHYATDEQNSRTQTYLALRTGGGLPSSKSPNGIHWHIRNPVEYVAIDAQRQDIVWVGVGADNGAQVEYYAKDSGLTPEQIKLLPRRTMDCLDCHNRATHLFQEPGRALDEAIANGSIDGTLPFVKREALSLLSVSYPTQADGAKAMQGLADFYRTQRPQVYGAQRAAIDQAAKTLATLYSETNFPEMNLTWKDYANNAAHDLSAGCFRCHDGQHLTASGESIRLNCNLCHSIPVVTQPGQKQDLSHVVNFVAQGGNEPPSHAATNFVRDHRFLANDACANCHGPAQFGADNSSFCANSACHAQKWPQADLNAAFPHPIQLVGQHANVWCNDCHKGVQKPANDCAACHKPPTQPHFGIDCKQCHTPQGWKASAAATTVNAPGIPHSIANITNCLTCHGPSGVRPAPASHQGRDTATCAACHKPAPGGGTQGAVGAPPVPHRTAGREACLTCHGAGKLQPVPTDHANRPNEACLLCHPTGRAGQ